MDQLSYQLAKLKHQLCKLGSAGECLSGLAGVDKLSGNMLKPPGKLAISWTQAEFLVGYGLPQLVNGC